MCVCVFNTDEDVDAKDDRESYARSVWVTVGMSAWMMIMMMTEDGMMTKKVG